MKRIFIVAFLLLFAISCRDGGQNVSGHADGFRQVIDVYSGRESLRDMVDFGSMKQGAEVTYRLGLRNADTVAMVILEIQNGCGCTSLQYDKQPVLPGDTASVRLLYDSHGQHGIQMKSMQIVTSLIPQPISVYLTADVHK